MLNNLDQAGNALNARAKVPDEVRTVDTGPGAGVEEGEGQLVRDNLQQDFARYQNETYDAQSLQRDGIAQMAGHFRQEYPAAYRRLAGAMARSPEYQGRAVPPGDVWGMTQWQGYLTTKEEAIDAYDTLQATLQAGREIPANQMQMIRGRVESSAADLYAQGFRLRAHLGNTDKTDRASQLYSDMDRLANHAIESGRSLLKELGSDQWTDKQWDRFQNGVVERMTPAGASTRVPLNTDIGQEMTANARRQVREAITQQLESEVGERARSSEKHMLAAIDEQAKKDFEWKGLGDWFASNWKNFLVPGSVLLMLFGGQTGRILGTLGLVGGAYDLYNRYQNLNGDPKTNPTAKHVQGALGHAVREAGELREAGEDNTADPFRDDLVEARVNDYISNLPAEEQRAALGLKPQMMQGIRDMGLLTRVGYHQKLREAVKSGVREKSEREHRFAWGGLRPQPNAEDPQLAATEASQPAEAMG